MADPERWLKVRFVAELVYPPVLLFARTVFRLLGIKFSVEGADHIPPAGGALLASNHVSYLDFTFCGLPALPSGRLIRYMAKDQIFHHKLSGPLMRGMHHIPVDRTAGTAAFEHAVQALKSGELVGIFPEATISRSFTLKEFKSGAARIAAAADVPLIPMATWGGQRIYTKGRKPDFSRGKAVSLAVGEPFRAEAGADPVAVTAELKRRVDGLLAGLQESYPQTPADRGDSWWLPADLGGTAPTLEAASKADAEDAAGRRARKKRA
jgi:1-acyl-sn-glycerol-3-phosphate acyltransferase